MTMICIDWSELKDESAFYDLVLPQCGAPSWHGRNLNALNDSWVAGSISEGGPPFNFRISNESRVTPTLVDFASEVREIAQNSIRENGGLIEN